MASSETQTIPKSQDDGGHGHLSPEELTSWLMSHFGKEPENAELPPQQMDMDWLASGFDTSRISMHEMEGGLNGFGIILENALTREECKRIIEETERIGYGHLGRGMTGRAYRGNCRLQIDDTGGKIGKEIWRRISKYIPRHETIPDEGNLEYLEMNTRYRFAKYFAGQGFAVHVDKPTVYDHEKCSVLTVNLYLNDLSPEQGGMTRFYRKMTGAGKPVAAAGGIAGSLGIFKQSLVPYSPVHDGEQVASGLKYLMRTDVIYKRVRSFT